MKTVELQLKERLLIVEFPENGFSLEKNIKAFIDSQKYINSQLDINEELEMICLGSELTEEIAVDLVEESKYMDLDGNSGYVDYKVYPDGLLLNPLHSFISAVEASGYHWRL
ncbi:hypothetical protein [Chryseobacterium indologenes]|uniref:Uncharacterized protein n=1 Tax=Chryseobacterium indologenes TaxID=253 RepID=A0A0N0IW19_CHRID|nr:hypothetical protein [Chryseobacterium indologenes]KPE51013.1 hypothetical protein AOB46_12565 [Chryseobacterium indologenes]